MRRGRERRGEKTRFADRPNRWRFRSTAPLAIPAAASRAGLSAPLGRPGRDARPQLHRLVRSACGGMSSR
ncbi:hypothetical protein GA830_19385 (plasmid) [Mesorhizobium sp. NBSH29]|nr:hypothetical protein GA830_19385 [Mesorhizobium sp. NBSH29]